MKSTPKKKEYMRKYMRERRRDPAFKIYKRMWNRLSRGSKLPVEFPPLRMDRGHQSKYDDPRTVKVGVSKKKKIEKSFISPNDTRERCRRCESLLKEEVEERFCEFCLKELNQI